MAAFCIARVSRGYVSPRRRADLPATGLWIDYLAAISVLILAASHLPGLLA